ncbi:MAG: nucleotidyltransferase domain-containing protein [Bacteroidia bacterium]|nr:nucleotidyltransferase domain-containing protein [Bacteroidia bacterium]
MDKEQAIEIAKRYIDFLKGKYDIRNVFLFGSFAKGTNHDDSDIDLAIVLNHITDLIDTQIELMKLRRSIDLRIEPHPFDLNDFNRTNPVVNEILKYGININVA